LGLLAWHLSYDSRSRTSSSHGARCDFGTWFHRIKARLKLSYQLL